LHPWEGASLGGIGWHNVTYWWCGLFPDYVGISW